MRHLIEILRPLATLFTAVSVSQPPSPAEASIQLAVTPEGGVVGGALLHGEGQGVHLVLHAKHAGKGGAQHILHRVALGIDRDLGDKPHAAARRDLHRAAVVVQLAGKYFEQRGLACAIAAQQAHPLAGVHLKRQAVQYFLFQVEGLHQSLYANVDHVCASNSLTIVSMCMAWDAFTNRGRIGTEGGADGGQCVLRCGVPLGVGGFGGDAAGLLPYGDDGVDMQFSRQYADGAVGRDGKLPQLPHVAQHGRRRRDGVTDSSFRASVIA